MSSFVVAMLLHSYVIDQLKGRYYLLCRTPLVVQFRNTTDFAFNAAVVDNTASRLWNAFRELCSRNTQGPSTTAISFPQNIYPCYRTNLPKDQVVSCLLGVKTVRLPWLKVDKINRTIGSSSNYIFALSGPRGSNQPTPNLWRPRWFWKWCRAICKEFKYNWSRCRIH